MKTTRRYTMTDPGRGRRAAPGGGSSTPRSALADTELVPEISLDDVADGGRA